MEEDAFVVRRLTPPKSELVTSVSCRASKIRLGIVPFPFRANGNTVRFFQQLRPRRALKAKNKAASFGWKFTEAGLLFS